MLRAGRVLVPLDTQMPDDELRGVLENCEASVALTSERLGTRLRALESDACPEVYRIGGDEDSGIPGWEELMDDAPGESREDSESVDPDATAVLFYTSGTTGPPKGVPLSHRNLCSQLEALADSELIGRDDRVLLPLPLHHVYPLVIGLFGPLAFGLPVILPAGLTGPGLIEAMREGGATVTIGVPRLYRAFYQGLSERVGKSLVGRLYLKLGFALGALAPSAAGVWFRPLRKKAAPSLRLLASGGSPLDGDLARALERLGWPVAVGYGLTETSPLLTLRKPGESDYDTVGRAVEGVELKVDSEALPSDREAEEEAEGKAKRGELLAKGPNVFGGYHRNEEASEGAFDAKGWFRTGDVARIEEGGWVYLEGRVSTRIALQGGENVDPEALEERYGAADCIEEIGILEYEGRLAALVRPTDDLLRENGGEAARRKVRGRLEAIGKDLASYQRIAKVEIRSRPLPRTRLGKLRRHELEEVFRSASKGEEERSADAPVPVDELSADDQSLLDDEAARALWDLLCERYSDRPVEPEAHLELDLGIDSMEWVELSMAIEEKTGIPVDEKVFGRADRVRDLLEAMASAEGGDRELRGRMLEDPGKVLDEEELKWTKPRGPVRMGIGLSIFFFLALFFRLWFRIRVEGMEKLPDEPYILAPNHGSYLDAPSLGVALGAKRARRCFWAGFTGTMFGNAFVREISRLGQVVPVDPRRGPVTSLASAALVLDRGAPLVWFPEGELSRDGSLQPFKSGIGLLLKHREEKVVPVRISGSHEALPPGCRWPRRRKIRVTIGEPIEPETLRGEAGEEAEAESITGALREAYEARTREAAGG